MTEDEYVLLTGLQAIRMAKDILSKSLPFDERVASREQTQEIMRGLRGIELNHEIFINEALQEE